MLKATKLTFAAVLLAGSCGLAIAQGTGSGGQGAADSGGVSTDKPANRDTLDTSRKQSQELKQGTTAPSSGGAAMQQKNTSMPGQAGPNETGTAKDTAGTATQRDPAKQTQPPKQ
jgi:hypothetical protein